MRHLLTALHLISVMFLIYLLFISGFSLNTPSTNKVQQHVNQPPIPTSLTFAGEPVPLYDREVRERLDREIINVTHQHSSTIRVMKLAYRILPEIEDILRRNGIPDDFKYLAMAESGLENVTSSKGAKGVWQFMEATARQYNMEVSEDVDERLHLEKSTQAACNYLRNANQRLNSWTMAAAGYNRGVSGMNDYTDDQLESSFYNLYLNTETSRYIFRILAYKVVMTNPHDYGYHFTTEDFYPKQATNQVEVTGIDNLTTFAKSYNTNYKTIKLLNPWMRTTFLKTKKDKTYLVKVPV